MTGGDKTRLGVCTLIGRQSADEPEAFLLDDKNDHVLDHSRDRDSGWFDCEEPPIQFLCFFALLHSRFKAADRGARQGHLKAGQMKWASNNERSRSIGHGKHRVY